MLALRLPSAVSGNQASGIRHLMPMVQGGMRKQCGSRCKCGEVSSVLKSNSLA